MYVQNWQLVQGVHTLPSTNVSWDRLQPPSSTLTCEIEDEWMNEL